MKTTNRDLLVLIKDEFSTESSMERELEQLNNLLFSVETLSTLSRVNEVLDFTRYRVVRKQKKVLKMLGAAELKPFQFICNKN